MFIIAPETPFSRHFCATASLSLSVSLSVLSSMRSSHVAGLCYQPPIRRVYGRGWRVADRSVLWL